MARRLEQGRAASSLAQPPLVPVSRSAPLPLSFAQQRLWFLDRLQPGDTSYNVPFAVRLTGALRIEALAAALAEILRRHEPLRTTFRSEGAEPVQIIAPPGAFVLPV